MEQPVIMVIALLEQDNRVLLLKRMRPPYVGFLGLPGGPLTTYEHVGQAAVRQVRQQLNMQATFGKYLGTISSRIQEDGEPVEHYLLHVCQLRPASQDLTNSEEGVAGWYPLDKLGTIKEKVIPVDYAILQHMLQGINEGYYEAEVEREGISYSLRRFTARS